MSIHSEIQNFKKNRSGDTPISIRHRNGDSEEGDSYFDLYDNKEKTPEEIVLNKGQARERAIFFKKYFAILSTCLSPDEIRFLKLKIKTRKPDKLIACWCGFSYRDVYKNIRDKLSAQQENIEELIDSSEWDNAELFAKMFLRSLKENSKDEDIIDFVPQDPFGDFDELKRAQDYRAERERIMSITKERHNLYCRGFEAGRSSERKNLPVNNERIIKILSFIQGMIDGELDIQQIYKTISIFISALELQERGTKETTGTAETA